MQENILINCTGLGAAKLFGGDLDLRPIRGQLVILPNNNPAQFNYFFSGGCDDDVAYMFARQNDIVIGGTWERNTPVDSPGMCTEADPAKCNEFLGTVRRIFNGDTAACHPAS
jgi:glycine/D-amino acid oxidase-like deaminating enzyme